MFYLRVLPDITTVQLHSSLFFIMQNQRNKSWRLKKKDGKKLNLMGGVIIGRGSTINSLATRSVNCVELL